jgi:hypothetical protein
MSTHETDTLENGELPSRNPDDKGDCTPLEDALELVERLDKIATVGAPSVIPNKDLANFISSKLAKSIAYHPDVRNTAYIQELMDSGFTKRNAQKIVWQARSLAKKMSVDIPVIQPVRDRPAASIEASTKPVDSAPSSSVGEKGKRESEARTAGAAGAAVAVAAGAAGAEVAGADADGVLTEYVRKLPATLPKPIRKIPVEYNIKERKKVSLASLRPDIFDREFEKSLRGLAPVTPGNAFGRYDPNPDLDKYPHTWDAVGNYHVPPNILAECLPYMAEEGLLEFHKVPLRAVQELEELRQLYIKKGLIGEYDRNVRPNSRNQVQSDPIDK